MALVSCSAFENPALEDCERYIQGKLRSPSTYKRTSWSGSAMKNGDEYWVSVQYDAANAYGTPVRDTQLCQFPAFKGQPDTFNYVDFDAAGNALDL
jgi:hypothetical protein